MRDLRQNAATVAKCGIGADSAPMVEIAQDLQAFLENVVRLSVLHIGDETDAAGIMLHRWVIETMGTRKERIDSTWHARACRGGQAFLLSFGVHFSAPPTVGFLRRPSFQLLKAYRGQGRCETRSRLGFTLRISFDPCGSSYDDNAALTHLIAARRCLVREWSVKLSYQKPCQK